MPLIIVKCEKCDSTHGEENPHTFVEIDGVEVPTEYHCYECGHITEIDPHEWLKAGRKAIQNMDNKKSQSPKSDRR